MSYDVKDINLAPQGALQIEWAEKEMGALLEVRKRFEKEKPLKGERIGMALHVTKETAVLLRTFKAGGAEVAITGCNPLSTQDDVAAALAKEGYTVYAKKGETTEEYYEYLNKVLDFRPTVTIDDGCDLVSEVHKSRPELIEGIKAGTEETTTGVIRLRAMYRDKALKYPVILVNDNDTKHLMDNYYGTGQSTFDGIIRATNLMVASKTIVVAGYGNCGKGCALRAKGLGAKVVVTEVKPFRALQAAMDGFTVLPMAQAAPLGDIFITVTGDINVIDYHHMEKMKDNAVICNSGHFDVEINLAKLAEKAKGVRQVRPFMKEYTLANKKHLNVLADGRLINLAAAEGHPSMVMSLSFCGQALAVEYGVKNKLDEGVHLLPEELDVEIARMQLNAYGIKIDSLTKEQEKYLASWQEGT
jgi:adenosylhomocysteinase